MSLLEPSGANCDNTSARLAERSAEQQVTELLRTADPEISTSFFQSPYRPRRQSTYSSGLLEFIMDISRPGETREQFYDALLDDQSLLEPKSKEKNNAMVLTLVDRETKARLAFRIHRDRFPPQIWNCCKNICFTKIAINGTQAALLEELLLIHEHAEKSHAVRENLPDLIQKRRKGIGTSTLAFVATSRQERESLSCDIARSNRQEFLRRFQRFVEEVLPFLNATADSPRGTPRPLFKLCTQAICCLLGVSRNFLYSRKQTFNVDTGGEELTSIVDSAGMRMRQHRRIGLRIGLPSVESLTEYDCGCNIPCFTDVPIWVLISEYAEFEKLSRELHPRHKENRFLLDRMYIPLSNSVTSVCNQALAALYNVSTTLIADVRLVLDSMCADSSSGQRRLLKDGSTRYKYRAGHPANRLPNWIRDKVEGHLDYVLRADPAGSTGESVCRLYSPEINTQEKLRDALKDSLSLEDSEDELSASTLQRMINSYLRKRNFHRISFTQSDHNACPTCKCLQYAILQYHHEFRAAKRDLKGLCDSPRPLTQSDTIKARELSDVVATRQCQEEECLNELKCHTSRDKRIREKVKTICDYFRSVENRYRGKEDSHFSGWSWNTYLDRARVTHQDDMTKVDLPHFIVTASSDITRWRYPVNAHVDVVSNDAVILSHEQGTGKKNGSVVVEEIILEHLLRCTGESIKVVISDNASVGKNWLTTIAFPQYIVDQGLAEVCIVVFLENNHGKYLADQLFGQFQTKRRLQTILGIDDLLLGFEEIKRRTGKVHGFAINPLSSVDFSEIFSSLGYQTTPPKDFGFVRRNIHFAAACVEGTKKRLSLDLMELLGYMLPDEAGMVRVSTEPPSGKPQNEVPYEERYVDVPAARLPATARSKSCGKGGTAVPATTPSVATSTADQVPLVVSVDKAFSESGNGVVSSRTAEKVGYNGISFVGENACPELRQTNSPVVRRAWPSDFFNLYSTTGSIEPVPDGASTKCAPENWIVREPVSHFCDLKVGYKARYPPRNMLNARCRKAPRESNPWLPTATYCEPPFPLCEKSSAHVAMKRLSTNHTDIGQSVHVLHALREVFREMSDHDDTVDQWMHRRATIPSLRAIANYRNGLQTYIEREKGRPKAAKGLRQVFREDLDTKSEVGRIEQEENARHPLQTEAAKKKRRDQICTRLFNQEQDRPGAMDRFLFQVRRDHERFTKELKQFKESRKDFDKDHGLLQKGAEDT